MRRKQCFICALVFIIFTVISGIVFAEDDKLVIKIEAENYESGSAIFYDSSSPLASGGKFISSWHEPQKNENYLYTYTFTAPQKGTYKMDGIFNELNQSFTTDISFYVNDPDNSVSSWSKGDRVGSLYMYKMSGGNVKLNKGVNTLYMKINGSDLNASGAITVYIDCFTFTKEANVPFSLEKVSLADTSAGVFEENNPVRLMFDYTAPTPEACSYSINITDFWNRNVLNEIITVKKGVESYTLSLGTFPIGWYRIRLKDLQSDSELGDYLAFSVVVSYSKRGNISDSSIAADSDIAWNGNISKLKNYKKDYHDMAKLCGIKWLRTRTAGKYSSQSNMDYGYMMKERGLNQLALTAVSTMGDQSATQDLFTYGYDLWKQHAQWYGDTLGALEVVNEADLSSNASLGSAERYAAYYKAAAIGISDAENKIYQTMTPTASSGGIWNDLLYRNDVLKYTDIQNYHAHEGVALRTKQIKEKQIAYSDSKLPIWLTEAGYTQITKEGDVLSLDQMKTASEQLIKRAMDSLSNGATKHFWFLLTPYIENGGNYSSHHPSGMPYPMYSVLSNLTYQLGEGRYIGVADVPAGMTGHMFSDGLGNDVMVLYSDSENYAVIKADKVRYSDITGYEQIKTADENGEIRIFAGSEPVFVKFFGKAPESVYFPKTIEEKLQRKTFTPAERIVIQQLWSNDITSAQVAHENGYQLKTGEEYEVSLKLYNFNDEKMSGVLKCSADNQIVWDSADKSFEIEPWGTQDLTYTFKIDENAEGGTDGNIRFWGTTDSGDEVSSSVAYFRIVQDGRVIAPDKRVNFENGSAENRWDLANIAETGNAKMSSDGENAIFKVKLPGNKWFFPFFHITDEEREALGSAQGFVFDAKASGHTGNTRLQMFVYMKDGRQYYSSSVGFKFEDMEKDYVCCIFPYTQFNLYSSPLGNVEIRNFDVDSISHISVGFSGSAIDVPEYRFKNFGYFYSDLKSEQLSSESDIEIVGVENNKTYDKVGAVKAYLRMPDEIASYKVTLNNKTLDNVTLNDKTLEFDLSGTERGAYTLYVTALNKQNKYFCADVSFNVK